MNYQTFELSNP